MQPINGSLWATFMLQESVAAPLLCPINFQNALNTVLHTTLGLSITDITHANCCSIYLRLVHEIEQLIADGSLGIPLALSIL